MLSLVRSNPALRRLFGKRELVIIEKQVLGVSLSQSERNRLSRDIRPKFRAVLELAPFAAEKNLKKGSQIKELVEEAKEVFLEHRLASRIIRVWLFGSTVENKRLLRSDVDLAVKFDSISAKEALLFRKETLAVLPAQLDVLVFNELPSKIKEEIQFKGRIVFERAS
ncbi:nucleotidyltransferase domain-containing protein [Candidatus Micrarchaeota archaeon]|nr:nucleotidyltransferase domain-containing protein [Candidatus Micrarchaeota archaeon]